MLDRLLLVIEAVCYHGSTEESMVSAAPLIILAFTVLLGILMNGYQTNKLGDRLEKLDAKIDQLEARFDAKVDQLEARLDAKIDRLDSKIDRLEAKLDTKIDQLEARLDAKIDRVDAKHSDKFDRNLEAAHRDALEIMRQMTSLHERVAVVEHRNAA